MTNIAQSVSTEASPAVLLDSERCQFAFADGRQCRMPALCASHTRAQAAKEPGRAAESLEPIDLDPLSGEFTTATEINRALGKVFLLLAQGRIPRRNAVALGYIAQLMLQTLPRVREEIIAVCGEQNWQDTLESAVCEEDTKDETNNDQTAPAAESNPENKSCRADSAEDQSEEATALARLGAPISRLAVFPAAPEPVESKVILTVDNVLESGACLGTPISVLASAGCICIPPEAGVGGSPSEAVCAALASPEPKSATGSSPTYEERIEDPTSRAPGKLPTASPVMQPVRPAPPPASAPESKYRENKIVMAQQLFRNEHLHKKGGRGGNLLIPNRNDRLIFSGNGRPFRRPR